MNPFWTTVARGVEDAANRHGHHVIICNTDESAAKQEEYLAFLLQKQVDGFLHGPDLPPLARAAAGRARNRSWSWTGGCRDSGWMPFAATPREGRTS